MVTVTIDITPQDERDILAIIKVASSSHGLAQIRDITKFLDWIWQKKRKGLTIHQKNPHTWHVEVPQ